MPQTKYTIWLVDKVTRTAKTIGKSLKGIDKHARMASSSINMMGVIAGGAAVAGVFKLGAELESTRLAFDTLTGSAEKGQKLFKELTDFANATPFQNNALNKNAKTMLAFGASTEDVISNLKMLGDIAAGDQERLNGLTLAFSQSRAAGRLMGQDLLQMINAGFNPLQTISEKTGKTMLELKKAMEKGQIPFSIVEEAFRAATMQGGRFHDLTTKMSETMAGKWSTTMGKAQFMIAEFGLSLKGIFLPILEKTIGIIDRMSAFMKNNEKAIVNWVKTLGTLSIALGAIIVVTKIWNAVSMANPYVAAVVGIAALITFIYKLFTAYNTVTTAVENFFEKFGAFRFLVTPFQQVYEAIRDIVGVIKVFKADGFMAGIKQMGKGILNFVLIPFENILETISKMTGLFKPALEKLKTFRKGLKFEETIKVNAKGAAKAYGDSFNTRLGLPNVMPDAKEDKKTPGFKQPEFDFNAALANTESAADKAKKLKAEGVVSGGIKTFNINIAGITGINTLTTNNMKESASQAGNMVTDALLEALSDIKNVG